MLFMSTYLNDGSTDAPRLRVYLNTDTLIDLPGHSIWPGLRGEAALKRLAADGFEGVQLGNPQGPISESQTLPFTGLDRINLPGEADAIFATHADRGDACITLHVGWGTEDDSAAHRLVEAVLNASEKYNLPAFVETHRATIAQDMWRTVQLTKVFPEMRFNGDFSHYYCGQEMVYGDFTAKLDFLQPIFDRIGYLHGRIATSGWMQARIENITDRPRDAIGPADYLADFKEMWRRAMRGFKRHAGPGDVLVFAPELLTPMYFYARLTPRPGGELVEEGDRYQEALLYKELATICYEEA
jgi:hypothetical protein